MSNPKPWKSCTDQLDLLISRGMIVTDKERALDYLNRIGYYRLSGYWYSFRQRSGRVCLLDDEVQGREKNSIVLDQFLSGSTFQNSVELYVFDKQLRLLALDALERIEVAVRAEVAYLLGQKDAFAYLRPDCFHKNFSERLDTSSGVTRHHAWLGKHDQLIKRSKEEFVRHNRQKYGLPLPIWVACEVWDFGSLSTLFGGMKEADQDVIAARYGVGNGRVFATWLRSLNYLRNVCAHHSRLWNRNIIDQPKLPPSTELAWVAPFESSVHKRARCFLLLQITQHLLGVMNPRSSWSQRTRMHLLNFPDLAHLHLDLSSMGAPALWQESW